MAQVLMLKMWGRLASLERSKSYVELETRRSARGTQGGGLATVTDVNRALERLARASDNELPAAWDALSRVVREYAAPGARRGSRARRRALIGSRCLTDCVPNATACAAASSMKICSAMLPFARRGNQSGAGSGAK